MPVFSFFISMWAFKSCMHTLFRIQIPAPISSLFLRNIPAKTIFSSASIFKSSSLHYITDKFPLTKSCMCVPTGHPQAQRLHHHMLLLLYLNVVLKVNDVVLGCCFECSVSSASLRSRDIVMILHHILESQWTFPRCDSSAICQSASAICTFFCKSLHTCYVELFFFPPPLWTNCQ